MNKNSCLTHSLKVQFVFVIQLSVNSLIIIVCHWYFVEFVEL